MTKHAVEALEASPLGHLENVAVAISDQLQPVAVSELASLIARRLRSVAVPASQQTWIVASSGDDASAARTVAALSDHAGQARLIVHDPRALDDLIFERRIPGQRRGGIYLNAAWQSASVRIACGEPLDLVDGLSAWFNPPARLREADLHADLLLRA